MVEFFAGLVSELASFFLSETLFSLRSKNRVLYFVVMGCILVLFGGMAVLFYSQGTPVKGTFMVVLTLLMLVMLLYTARKDKTSERPGWNSWFSKRR